jgi:hypothetical protein
MPMMMMMMMMMITEQALPSASSGSYEVAIVQQGCLGSLVVYMQAYM